MSQNKPPRLSATVLLVRDGTAGLEVFMVVRHHQIDFASGALVFPGGSLDEGDKDPALIACATGAAGLNDAARALRVAAAREAFEECGVLLARERGERGLVSGDRAAVLGQTYRQALEAGKVGMAELATRERLDLALEELVPWAHWITPTHMPKRFDTYFYVARAPGGHALAHDGREAVDSVWVPPQRALADADAGRRTVIFPTRLNLQKLAQFADVEALLAHSRATPVVRVEPTKVQRGAKTYLRIPIDAGYGATEFEVTMHDSGAMPVRRP